MVKRLRHRPFTAVTRVRVPVGSPLERGFERILFFISGRLLCLPGPTLQSIYADVVELVGDFKCVVAPKINHQYELLHKIKDKLVR